MMCISAYKYDILFAIQTTLMHTAQYNLSLPLLSLLLRSELDFSSASLYAKFIPNRLTLDVYAVFSPVIPLNLNNFSGDLAGSRNGLNLHIFRCDCPMRFTKHDDTTQVHGRTPDVDAARCHQFLWLEMLTINSAGLHSERGDRDGAFQIGQTYIFDLELAQLHRPILASNFETERLWPHLFANWSSTVSYAAADGSLQGVILWNFERYCDILVLPVLQLLIAEVGHAFLLVNSEVVNPCKSFDL